MAKPIRETPILFGEDGKIFEEKMQNALLLLKSIK